MQQSRKPVVNVIVAEANQMNCQLVESAFRPRRRRVAVLASAVNSKQALQLLKEKGLVGRPVNIMRDADGFWVKMHSEGLVKQPYSLRTRQNRTSQTQLKAL